MWVGGRVTLYPNPVHGLTWAELSMVPDNTPISLVSPPLVRAYDIECNSHSEIHCLFSRPLHAFDLHHAEWIKGLLAVPFVLYSQPTGAFDPEAPNISQATEEAHRRYAEIMRDVEVMLDDHSKSRPSIDHHRCGGNSRWW